MGSYGKTENVILLFDNYSTESQNLHTSFKQAGKDYPAVVIEDDGFLSDDVVSVFNYFLKNHSLGKPRYFNQIEIPDYWEITANNTSGKVYEFNKERARIIYAAPTHKRMVKAVDWLDEKGVVRLTEHYDKYGNLYARTVSDAKGKKITKAYIDCDGKEVIVRNYVTRDIVFNDGNNIKLFDSLHKFVSFFIERAGYKNYRIFYNSLSTSFLVSHTRKEKTEDILFWNEQIGNEIPGNMKLILEGKSHNTKKIMVQRRDAYERLLVLGVQKEKMENLGYCYAFKRENANKPNVIICTNSDNIAKCNELVNALPNVHFHILAITEMSSKLMSMETCKNVSLYPGVKTRTVNELFDICDMYLDINYGTEILDAVNKAFLHNQLILAFKETVHNGRYIAKEHIYSVNEYERMIKDIKDIFNDKKKMNKHVEIQHKTALCEKADAYTKL